MKLLDNGTIFNSETAPAPFRACCFTSLRRLASGVVLATFQFGSAKNAADTNGVIAESLDGGRTWRTICKGFQSTFDGRPGNISAAEVVETAPGILVAFLTWFDRSECGKSLYDSASDNILPSRLVLAKSRDGGRTWDSYRALDTGAYGGCSGTGAPTRLNNGEWLLPFESYSHRGGGDRAVHTAACFATRDGDSLSPVLTVAEDSRQERFYWDQRLACATRQGRPVAMFWTYDRASEKDLPIHIAWGDPSGRTWEPPRSTGIQGQISAPIPLADGRLLAFYVHRHPPGSLRLIASMDDGRTWDLRNEISVYDSPGQKQPGMSGESDYAQYWADMGAWTFGHPTGVALDAKTILLAYYAGRSRDCMSACWARVEV